MNKIMGFCCFFMFCTSQIHAGVSIDPVQLYISGKDQKRTTTVTLESKDEAEKKVFEVNAVKWTQNDKGEDIYEADSSLLINPKNFILQPNAKQVIRVGFNRPIDSVLSQGQEGTWRIIINEMQQATKGSTVNFLVSFNMPLFVGQQENIKLNFSTNSDHLIVKNDANSHIRISNLKVLDTNKKVVYKSEQMKYLLAKKSTSYALKDVQLKKSTNYIIQFNSDKNDDVVELKFSN